MLPLFPHLMETMPPTAGLSGMLENQACNEWCLGFSTIREWVFGKWQRVQNQPSLPSILLTCQLIPCR